MASEYGLLPTQKQRGITSPPQGWVQFAPGINTKRRTMTEGYLKQRMPRTNTIAQNQNYVTKVMENPRTPAVNRNAVIDFVLNHPERFMALCDRTDDPTHNEWARKKNGGAEFGFLRNFRQRYLGHGNDGYRYIGDGSEGKRDGPKDPNNGGRPPGIPCRTDRGGRYR